MRTSDIKFVDTQVRRAIKKKEKLNLLAGQLNNTWKGHREKDWFLENNLQ